MTFDDSEVPPYFTREGRSQDINASLFILVNVVGFEVRITLVDTGRAGNLIFNEQLEADEYETSWVKKRSHLVSGIRWASCYPKWIHYKNTWI